jgi:hypothetical protein
MSYRWASFGYFRAVKFADLVKMYLGRADGLCRKFDIRGAVLK